MAAIDSYDTLVAAIVDFVHRDSDETTAIAPTLIQLAEEAISEDLADLPMMRREETGIVLAGLARDIEISPRALGLESLSITTSGFECDLRIVVLDELPGDDFAAVYGVPECAAIVGANNDDGAITVRVYPWADQGYTFKAFYPATVLPLGTDQATNFVLARAPSLYLFGALKESVAYLGQDARIPTWEAKYAAALDRFKSRTWTGDVTLGTEVAALVGRGTFDIRRGF